ncbi:MAG: GNAT family N-acetyltransferase, partial [Eggerthellaceae bacterium]|nr:GNAT family N-acetyltransferase [Eggerthellaceae bacterium]
NAPIDISNVVLHTERLTLRPWRQADLEDFFAYASVDRVGQMAGWKPHESIEESQTILDKFIAEKKTFALELDGRVVGSLGIENYNEERFPEFADKQCREIGYVLAKDCWGRGLMPEAVREVIRYLFKDVGLDVILCGYYVWNRQSKRVQEKCGFVPYATGTHTNKLGNTEEDVKNILTREDWLAAKDAQAPAGEAWLPVKGGAES